MLGRRELKYFLASVNLTPAKTNLTNNFARYPERGHRNQSGSGDVIRRHWPPVPVEASDLPNLFQPVIQPGKTLSDATGAEALCQ
jgi:hypothetical protein